MKQKSRISHSRATGYIIWTLWGRTATSCGAAAMCPCGRHVRVAGAMWLLPAAMWPPPAATRHARHAQRESADSPDQGSSAASPGKSSEGEPHDSERYQGGFRGGNEPSDLSAFQGNHGIWPPGTPRKNLLHLRPGRAEVSVKALRTDEIAFQEITGPGRGNRARASGSLRPSLACHGTHAEIPWNPRRSGATALPGGSWAAGDSLMSAHGPRGSVGKSPTNR